MTRAIRPVPRSVSPPTAISHRTTLGLPAEGDVAPYNAGPAITEGEHAFVAGVALGSGQMNGLASGILHFQEANTVNHGSAFTTAGSDPAKLDVEEEDYPALTEVNTNPLFAANGDEYVSWSSSQCNACGHHTTTSFANPTATQPAITWNSREYNWSSTKAPNGAWQ